MRKVPLSMLSRGENPAPLAASDEPPAGPPRGTGVVLRDAVAWDELRTLALTAEDTGYSAVFVPEIAGREAFGTLAGLAATTARIHLGTGVIPMTSRTPVTTAMGAATVQELSGGRFVLGLGTGTPGPGSTLQRLEEYVRVVRGALAGEEVRSEAFGVDGFRSALAPETGPPPIWVGALGDRMLELAGRVADGVILNWCPPQRVAEARRRLMESAERANRGPAEVTVAVYVRACLGVEDEVALAALRPMTAQYAALPHYRAQMEAVGLGEEAAVAAAAHQAGKPNDVPETLVRALAAIGGRRDGVDRLKAYRTAGADLVLLYPVAVRDPFGSMMTTMLTAAPELAVER